MLSNEKIKFYQDTAAAIAAELGAEWTPSRPTGREYDQNHCHSSQTIYYKNGSKFRLSFDNWGEVGRIAVYGVYPTQRNGQRIYLREEPRITISYKRPAAAIAADITRRFLPKHEAYHARCLEIIAEDDPKIYWTRAAAVLLCDTLGCHVSHFEKEKEPENIKDTCVTLHHRKATNVKLAGYNQTVTIERITSIDLETAAAILELLQ